jgi:hypothetical protein
MAVGGRVTVRDWRGVGRWVPRHMVTLRTWGVTLRHYLFRTAGKGGKPSAALNKIGLSLIE